MKIRRWRSGQGLRAAAVVVLFTLGIGSSLAVYSLVDAILWQPLRAPQADRLVRLFATDVKQSEIWNGQSVPVFEDYREATSFESLAAFSLSTPMHLSWGDGPARRVEGGLVSGSYLPMLGVKATLGRTLAASDDRPEATPVAVASHRLFRESLGADPSWIGRSIRINGKPVTLVGVAEPGTHSVEAEAAPAIWVPLARAPEVLPQWADAQPLSNRRFSWVGIVGRLRPGASIASAQAELDVIAKRRAVVETDDPMAKVLPAAATTLGDDGSPATRRLAWILVAAAALVLLAACLNASSLLLASTERRQGEIAVRLALGASPDRLARGVVVESVALATCGAGLGLLLAWATVSWLGSPIGSLGLPVAAASPLADLRAALGALALAVGSGVLSAWGPWRRARRISLQEDLQTRTRSVTGGSRARHLLVVGQVAATAVLLFAAGLLLATLRNVGRIDLGFDAMPLALASIELAPQGYDKARGLEFQRRLLDELARDPTVAGAALGSQWPLQASGMRHTLKPEGYVFAPDEDEGATYNPISPGYFATLAVPLVAGREFTADDRAGGRQVAMVNQAFARRFFAQLAAEQVIGRRVDFGEGDVVEIVGVSRDTKGRELRAEPSPAIFVPLEQRYVSRVTVAARARSGNDSLVARAAIERALARLDRDLPSYGARTAGEQLQSAIARERALSAVLGGFSVLALALSFAGIFGVLSFEVQTRRRELGIRSALGAEAARLAGGVLRNALRLTALGVACGALPAWLASRLLSSVLYEISPGDPRAIGAVLAVVALAALAAGGGPAIAAARVDPARLLQSD